MLTQEAIQELKKRLMNGEVEMVGSAFNDNTHSAWASKPIRELKFYPKVAEKLFFPLLMAFPFDPIEGKETPDYNPRNKWSALIAPSEMVAVIKSKAQEDETYKNFFVRQAHFKGEWDVSDPSIMTADDIDILWRYRRRLTYAFPSTKVFSSSIGGDKYPTTYLLLSKQDPITGEFVGDLSFLHQAASLLGSLCQNEINSFNEAIESKDPNTLSKAMNRTFTASANYLKDIPTVDHNDAKARRGDIRACYALTAPQPLLTTIGFAFPVTPVNGSFLENIGKGQYDLYEHFKQPIDWMSRIFYTANYAATDFIDGIIGNYFPKNPKKYKERNADVDHYADFCVVDYITENTATTFTKDEKMKAALETKFATEKKPLYITEEGRWAHEALKDFAAQFANFPVIAEKEKLVDNVRGLLMQSYKMESPAMETAVIREIYKNYPLTAPVYTDQIKLQYADVLSKIFPEEMATYSLEESDKFDKEGEALYQELLSAEQDKISSGDAPDDEEQEFLDVTEVVAENIE